MIRRTSLVLALAVLASACSDSDPEGPRMATIDEVKVVKVSGDQSAPVLGQGIASTPTPAGGLSLQTVPAGEYTPEPLVGRVEPTVQARGTSGTGPSGLVVPVGTLVHWDLPAEAGRLLATTTATDDSAYVINRWAPGTKAGTYTVRAQRILGTGEIVTDATWQVTVKPGRVHGIDFAPLSGYTEGDTVDLRDLVLSGFDVYGNVIEAEAITALNLSAWELYIPAMANLNRPPDRAEPKLVATGTGWIITIPPARPADGHGRMTYFYQLTVDGVYGFFLPVPQIASSTSGP